MIAQQTTIQAYQLRKGGTAARMAILRMIAADSTRDNKPPSTHVADWRAARHYTLGSYESAFCCSLSQGFNGEPNKKRAVWYAFSESTFRNERYAHEVLKLGHTGWYDNPDGESSRDGSGLIRGIVGGLSHGRFIAGYELGSSDERVYFDCVYSDEDSAARAADSHAETIADKECEYQTVWREARDVEDENENAFTRLRECIALRNRACMNYVRDEIRELCETIRTNRERLAGEFADYS